MAAANYSSDVLEARILAENEKLLKRIELFESGEEPEEENDIMDLYPVELKDLCSLVVLFLFLFTLPLFCLLVVLFLFLFTSSLLCSLVVLFLFL